jgi:hypothetical protein
MKVLQHEVPLNELGLVDTYLLLVCLTRTQFLLLAGALAEIGQPLSDDGIRPSAIEGALNRIPAHAMIPHPDDELKTAEEIAAEFEDLRLKQLEESRFNAERRRLKALT